MAKLIEITGATRDDIVDVLEKYDDYGIDWVGNLIIKTPVPVRVSRRELFGPMLYLTHADVTVNPKNKTVLIHGFGDESKRQPEAQCVNRLVDEGIEPEIKSFLEEKLLWYLRDHCKISGIKKDDIEFKRALNVTSAEFKYDGVWYKLFYEYDELEEWIETLDKEFDIDPYTIMLEDNEGTRAAEDPDVKDVIFIFDPLLPKRKHKEKRYAQ